MCLLCFPLGLRCLILPVIEKYPFYVSYAVCMPSGPDHSTQVSCVHSSIKPGSQSPVSTPVKPLVSLAILEGCGNPHVALTATIQQRRQVASRHKSCHLLDDSIGLSVPSQGHWVSSAVFLFVHHELAHKHQIPCPNSAHDYIRLFVRVFGYLSASHTTTMARTPIYRCGIVFTREAVKTYLPLERVIADIDIVDGKRH